MHTRPFLLTRLGLLSAAALMPVKSNAITFNLTDVTPGGMSATALSAFQDAAAIWEGIVLDNIEVNLDIRFDGNDFNGDPMAPTTLGSTGRSFITPSYTAVRNALVAETTPSTNDSTAIANLPAGPSVSYLTNNHNTSAVFLDNNNSNNNNFLDLNVANARALGLWPAVDATTDARIAFNTAFSWDFDQSDGIGAGLQDFIGVTVHEIGHALGFRSGADAVDATHGSGPDAPTDLDTFAVITILDLYRFSGPGQMDISTGGAPYFSIDGGATNLATFSTGSFNGDGRQASHWKDNLGLGLFDPTANPPGELNQLSLLDVEAIDVLGFDVDTSSLVPEQSTTLLAFIALGFTSRRRRS